jgi:hypothetical protein
MLEPPEVSLRHQRLLVHKWMADCSCQLCRRSCNLCVFSTSKRFKLYCKQCANDIDECMKDAVVNDWMADFETMQGFPERFRAMVDEFRQQGPPNGSCMKRRKLDRGNASRPRSEASKATASEPAECTSALSLHARV